MYTIGTQYLPHGKHATVCTVTDIHTTHNSKGEQVNLRYVASHQFCGQTVTEQDVCAVTVARGIARLADNATV